MKCLNEDQFQKVYKSIKELDTIKRSQSSVTVLDPIIIIQDWEGRVYVSGGEKKPVRAIVQIGPTIKREVAINVDTKIHERERSEEPPFRIRYRFHTLILPVEMIRDKEFYKSIDVGLGLDLFHIGDFNLSIHTGILSSGMNVGYDITKNFGFQVGAGFIYDKVSIGPTTGIYFSFN